MPALKVTVAIAWIAFWAYWLLSAIGVKTGWGGRRRTPLSVVTGLAVALLIRVFRNGGLAVHSPVVGALGLVILAAGLALAVWARVHLGRNWGMPMSEKAEPELVTSGPYRLVRHPIYAGIIAGMIGTALVTNLLGLVIAAILGGYFYYSASVEEKNLIRTFPNTYPAYRAQTKMLIPFVV